MPTFTGSVTGADPERSDDAVRTVHWGLHGTAVQNGRGRKVESDGLRKVIFGGDHGDPKSSLCSHHLVYQLADAPWKTGLETLVSTLPP